MRRVGNGGEKGFAGEWKVPSLAGDHAVSGWQDSGVIPISHYSQWPWLSLIFLAISDGRQYNVFRTKCGIEEGSYGMGRS